MRPVSTALHLLLGAALTLAGLEVALRLLPVSSATMVDYHIAPDILTYPPHHDFTVATGWDLKNAQHLRSNNLGFVDTQDFVANPAAIAVIGDSFVEANMLPPQARIGPALSRALGGAPVYSMGGPGASVLDYAARARLAANTLAIRRFVFVIELGDVRQALCGSGNHQGPCIHPATGALEPFRHPSASGLKSWARHSALAQYLFSQLQIDPFTLMHALMPASAAPAQAAADPVSPAVARWIIARFLDTLPRTGQPPLLLIDGPRGQSSQEVRWNLAHMALLRQMAEAAGAQVVDLAPHFERWRSRHGLSVEVGPYDAHWNAAGHQIAADAAADALRRP